MQSINEYNLFVERSNQTPKMQYVDIYNQNCEVYTLELGWIDFSKEERAKVLDVINLLAEDETLDELGISAIRDGFANMFFPGTSTIQTRAKYFLIVPYALEDLEYDKTADPQKLLKMLDDTERHCGEIMLKSGGEGVIGSRNLKSGNWVQRTPADIYWNGIRTYGIFTGGNLSLYQYIKASSILKIQKGMLKAHRNIREDAEEGEKDDNDAGVLFSTSFWRLPEHQPGNWIDVLKIELTPTEASFLKHQIINNCPDSLFAFILRHNLKDVIHFDSFEDMADGLLQILPSDMREDILLAKAASEFIYGMRIRYNFILSQGQNEFAKSKWAAYSQSLSGKANVDINKVFIRLNITNRGLYSFLLDIQKAMKNNNIIDMDERIIKRECQLKTNSRAKLLKAGEFPTDAWFGGGRLDYRFNSAKQIIKDIYEGECDENA